MKRKLKKGIALGLSVIMALSLTACSQQLSSNTEEDDVPKSETDSGQAAQIVFSWWGGDSRHVATEQAVNAFMAKYPNIAVVPEYGAWTGWEEKQSLALIGGNAADMMQINWNWIDNYSKDGANFLDLYEYSDIIDLSQFPQESLDQCSVDGKLMAIPVSNTGCLFYWNKSTFETIGCELPTDKESLLAAGAKFKEYGEDYYPFVIDSGFSRMIFMVYYLESVYGRPWVQDGELQYSVEEIQEGFDFICELEAAHAMPTLATTNGDMADSTDKNPKWIDGKYAGAYVWDASSIKMEDAVRESVNVANQELVQGEFLKLGDYNGGYTKISMAYAIPASSQNPEAAATLIEYLLNDPEGVEICGLERGVPLSSKGVSIIEEKGIGDPRIVKANKAVLEFSKFALDSKFDSNDLKANPDGTYEKVFGKLSFGEIDSATAAQTLYESVTEVLSN